MGMHGEAVACDMAYMSVLSNVLGLITVEERDRILNMLRGCEVPVYSPCFTRGFLIEALADRVQNSMGQRLPMPVGIGKAKMANDVSDADFERAFVLWQELCKTETSLGDAVDSRLAPLTRDWGLDIGAYRHELSEPMGSLEGALVSRQELNKTGGVPDSRQELSKTMARVEGAADSRLAQLTRDWGLDIGAYRYESSETLASLEGAGDTRQELSKTDGVPDSRQELNKTMASLEGAVDSRLIGA